VQVVSSISIKKKKVDTPQTRQKKSSTSIPLLGVAREKKGRGGSSNWGTARKEKGTAEILSFGGRRGKESRLFNPGLDGKEKGGEDQRRWLLWPSISWRARGGRGRKEKKGGRRAEDPRKGACQKGGKERDRRGFA